jgi:preprotein translocase subunit SecD
MLASLARSLHHRASLQALAGHLTLAGIATFIMSVGMAVDANVRVFERLKGVTGGAAWWRRSRRVQPRLDVHP